jgi:hypothetical protein
VTDLLDSKGSQHGYYNNVHADKGRDWGTFEGKVSAAGGKVTVEGTYKFIGGTASTAASQAVASSGH